MSVAIVINPPDTPSTGALEFIPLGGDGKTAPDSAWFINDVQLTGDASGGNALFSISPDERYTHLIGWVSFTVQVPGAATSVQYKFNFGGGAKYQGTVSTISATIPSSGDKEANKTIIPAADMIGKRSSTGTLAQLFFLNTTSNEYFLSAMIYNYDIDVRQKTPLGPLFASRGFNGHE